MTTLFAYYRVSTARQGDSGLGLEGQQHAVESYSKAVGATLAGSFTEVESGRKSDRPQLAQAIAAAKRAGGTLVIAKLDRLSRSVSFVANLMDSNIDFVACDNPSANKLTIHILSAVAQAEAEAISSRTKAALSAAKRRGVKLGTPKNLTLSAKRKGAAANSEAATRHNEAIKPLAQSLRNAGQSLREIAGFLTSRNLLTRTGRGWTAMGVKRLLA